MKMNKFSYEQIVEEQGFKLEEVKQGYAVFHDNEFKITVIQKLDCLEEYGMAKFKNDTEAGEQALKDGYKLFTVDHERLTGWYILDTPENRKILENKGVLE